MNTIITDNSNAEHTISSKVEIAHQIMDAFILSLPAVWKQKLKLSA